MKTLFKISALMLITSWTFEAQTETETLYSKSYDTNVNTTALLEFRGSSVEISTSLDNKFHVEYYIEFINYPNRKKKEAIEKVKIESKLENNQITLSDESRNRFYNFYSYRYDALLGRLNAKNNETTKAYNYKSEVDVSKEIFEAKKPVSWYVRYIQNSQRYDESEKQKMIEKHKNRKQKKYNKKIIIKIPKHLSLTINAKASKIRIEDNLENQISLRADGGMLHFKNLNNSNNIVKIKDASLIANSINGGKVVLDNAKRTIIGKLKNVKLNSEFSQLEIGNISNNVEITDFTSKYLIHNFSKDFETLNMNTEYSEVNLFLPKNGGYKLTTFGNYTKHFVENKLVEFPAEKSDSNSKMLDLKSNDNESNLSAIKINTVNGIIRIAKDVINFIE